MKIYIISGRFGVEMERPKIRYTRKDAEDIITQAIYEHLTEQLSEDIEEAGIDIEDKAAVLNWAEENDYCRSYNTKNLIDTATVGDDWLEYMITEEEVKAA